MNPWPEKVTSYNFLFSVAVAGNDLIPGYGAGESSYSNLIVRSLIAMLSLKSWRH